MGYSVVSRSFATRFYSPMAIQATKKSALVIGAGVGGLAIAIRLRALGFSVQVFAHQPVQGCNIVFLEGEHGETTAGFLVGPFGSFERDKLETQVILG